MMSLNRWTAIIALSLTGLVIGCQTTSPQATYYTLSVLGETAAPKTIPAAVVGVGPLDLPDYLDRQQIVTRPAPNRLQINDYQRWAGPLKDDMLRVLRDNVKALTGAPSVVAFPWPSGQRPDLAVSLTVHAFEGEAGDRVILKATATLRNLVTKSAPESWDIHSEQAAPLSDYEALVAAQSRAMAEASRSIAQKLMTVTP